MKIQILIDNPNSWIIPYAKKLKNDLNTMGNDCFLRKLSCEVTEGDILILLSCEKKFNQFFEEMIQDYW